MSRAANYALTLAVAALAATAVYLPQHGQLQRTRADFRELEARHAAVTVQRDQALTERDRIAKEVTKVRAELESLKIDRSELAHLREQADQLRKERDVLRQRVFKSAALATAGAPGATGPKPTGYIARDQLTFVGYESPEAALESMTWSMMAGDFELCLASLGPEMRLETLANENAVEEFEFRRQLMAPLFKGMQILASKAVSEDIVELKVQVDSLPSPNAAFALPSVVIQPMVKVAEEWKVGNAERTYEGGWDTGSQPEPAPAPAPATSGKK